VPPDTAYERIALLLKRQLEAVGVVMSLQEVSHVEIGRAFKTREFEAVLVDPISGPTVLRPYRWWHSRGTQNVGFSSESVDAALDRIRHAANDEAYRGGVEAFQRAIVEDPPAIFLAWTQRARAVSTRFDVPVEPGRDILSTLRLWRPLGRERRESSN
jgi:ABC-type transport system substrate-binding protein